MTISGINYFYQTGMDSLCSGKNHHLVNTQISIHLYRNIDLQERSGTERSPV